MSHNFLVNARALGRKSPLLSDWSVPFPAALAPSEAVSLRELITYIVHHEVAAFQDRQHRQRFLQVLSERDIAEGTEKGAIRSGASDVPEQSVDPAVAVQTALQAFEDGLYLVLIDNEEVRDLNVSVPLRPQSRITFLRMTLLAGG